MAVAVKHARFSARRLLRDVRTLATPMLSLLGPSRTLKLVVSPTDDSLFVLTSSAIVIVQGIRAVTPALQVLHAALAAQDEQCGNSTTTLAVLVALLGPPVERLAPLSSPLALHACWHALRVCQEECHAVCHAVRAPLATPATAGLRPTGSMDAWWRQWRKDAGGGGGVATERHVGLLQHLGAGLQHAAPHELPVPDEECALSAPMAAAVCVATALSVQAAHTSDHGFPLDRSRLTIHKSQGHDVGNGSGGGPCRFRVVAGSVFEVPPTGAARVVGTPGWETTGASGTGDAVMDRSVRVALLRGSCDYRDAGGVQARMDELRSGQHQYSTVPVASLRVSSGAELLAMRRGEGAASKAARLFAEADVTCVLVKGEVSDEVAEACQARGIVIVGGVPLVKLHTLATCTNAALLEDPFSVPTVASMFHEAGLTPFPSAHISLCRSGWHRPEDMVTLRNAPSSKAAPTSGSGAGAAPVTVSAEARDFARRPLLLTVAPTLHDGQLALTSVLVVGHTPDIVDEGVRSFHKCLSRLESSILSQSVLPGGGTWQMCCAAALRVVARRMSQASDVLDVQAAETVDAVADCLEMLVCVALQNCGVTLERAARVVLRAQAAFRIPVERYSKADMAAHRLVLQRKSAELVGPITAAVRHMACSAMSWSLLSSADVAALHAASLYSRHAPRLRDPFGNLSPLRGAFVRSSAPSRRVFVLPPVFDDLSSVTAATANACALMHRLGNSDAVLVNTARKQAKRK